MPPITRDVILRVDTHDPAAWLMSRQGALSWFAADHGTRLDDIAPSAPDPQHPLATPAFVATLSGSEKTLEQMLRDLLLPEATRRFGVIRVERTTS